MKSKVLLPTMLLTDFQMIRPPFETSQEETLDWLVEAHVKSEGNEAFRQTIKEKIWHVGCKPDRITKRGHVLGDFTHRDWEKMDVYRLDESPFGKDLCTRSKVFEIEVDKVFDQYYPEGAAAPDDLIHVTCTGYVAPSGAQKIVSKRNWGNFTTVTHAYHMGCYGSIPAIRMGLGFLGAKTNRRADIVHTEVCCLHMNPFLHQLDQLVSQSLFGDGFIKYSLLHSCNQPHVRVINLKEEIIPQSSTSMTWDVHNWGHKLSLAKEVPVLITRHLPGYLQRLCKNAIPENALFAVHPGGPKILVHVQQLLGLTDHQMSFSFQLLKEYGNMSSATLPHIWQNILNNPTVPDHTPIISLAFGPGLTIAGALMEKVCGF